MNIELTSTHGGEKLLVNWDNVAMAKTMEKPDNTSVFDTAQKGGEKYTEITLTSKRLVYVNESLKEILKSLDTMNDAE